MVWFSIDFKYWMFYSCFKTWFLNDMMIANTNIWIQVLKTELKKNNIVINSCGLKVFAVYNIPLNCFQECSSSENGDGCFAGQRYFSCPPGAGVFVNVSELELLIPHRDTSPTPMVSRHSSTQTYQSTASMWVDELPARPSSTDTFSSKAGKYHRIQYPTTFETLWWSVVNLVWIFIPFLRKQ